jgi:hypothetical protein
MAMPLLEGNLEMEDVREDLGLLVGCKPGSKIFVAAASINLELRDLLFPEEILGLFKGETSLLV